MSAARDPTLRISLDTEAIHPEISLPPLSLSLSSFVSWRKDDEEEEERRSRGTWPSMSVSLSKDMMMARSG
jgi:hypothetical protein